MLKNNKILILCHPRSRSSYACNIISSYQKNKHGYRRELPWELLNGKQIEIEKYLTKLQKLKLKEEDQKRVNEDIEFFSKRWQYAPMFRELANDDKPFVLKYFPGAYDILNVDVMKELRSEKSSYVKIITLYRRNLLKTAMSELKTYILRMSMAPPNTAPLNVDFTKPSMQECKSVFSNVIKNYVKFFIKFYTWNMYNLIDGVYEYDDFIDNDIENTSMLTCDFHIKYEIDLMSGRFSTPNEYTNAAYNDRPELISILNKILKSYNLSYDTEYNLKNLLPFHSKKNE